MPYIHVSTNVPKAGVDASAAVRALSKAVSETLGKPEAYIMAQLDLEVPMLFQASDAPCAFIHLRSIGKISPEQNALTAKALTETVANVLNVPADRVFANFDDIERSNWAMGGQTF